MVLRPQPIVETLEALHAARGGASRTILLSPQGARFDQRAAERLAREPALTFVCGRYEGFDERIRSFVDEELSIGDFVLLGGEAAALCVIEATARLVPGVIGNLESTHEESHTTGLLEYPHYTRPAEFRGMSVPEVLRSGNHARIAAWRREEAIRRTFERRPELLADARRLGEGIVALQAENGRFHPQKLTWPQGMPSDHVSIYYPGEACLALARLSVHTDDGRLEDPVAGSDMLMLLRYGSKPGEGRRQELERISPRIWRIKDEDSEAESELPWH